MGQLTHAEMQSIRDNNKYKPQYQRQEVRRVHEEHEAHRQHIADQRKIEHITTQKKKKDLLIQTTCKIIAGIATPIDFQFIIKELADWKWILLDIDAPQLRYLIENISSLPVQLQQQIQLILPLLELSLFSFTGELIQRSELSTLLSLAQHSFVLPVIQKTEMNFLFVTKLKILADNLDEEVLNEQHVLCLQRLINDYQINLLGKKNIIDNIIMRQLSATTTLSQLTPKQEITQGLNINVANFALYLDSLTQRIASLPLNVDTRKTINTVILPGILSIINDEQTIIEHVQKHHGTLYYISETLPLHTDHVAALDTEEYRKTLHRLLINFFHAADVAYNKGCLHIFCEKICFGYCFEGRVRDVFMWAASLSEALSFHQLMEQYYHKEYLPYTSIMVNNDEVNLTQADPIIDFIITRHKKEICNYDATYAPSGTVTMIGVKKYLRQILDLTSQRDCDDALSQTRILRQSLERNSLTFWNYPWRSLIKTKINALTALEQHIKLNNVPAIAAREIKQQFPEALAGANSRTKKLLMDLEQMDETTKSCIAR